MKQRLIRRRSKDQLLAHHRHTGRVLPMGQTSYPALLFVLLLVGVLLTRLTLTVQATDVSVTARVAGLPPTQPAVITSPPSGTHVTNPLLPISGTCPPATIIEIYRNGLFDGSTLCNADGTFSMGVGLFWGTNVLLTHIFNLGDTEGPNSPSITVYLDGNPHVYSSNPGSTNSNGSSYYPSPGGLLNIETTTAFQGGAVGDLINWRLTVTGGNAPYAISVSWGDGSTSLFSQSRAGEFNISHRYEKVGGYHGVYTIKINTTDASGNQAYMQLFVLINGNSNVGSISLTRPTNSGGISGSTSQSATRLIWSAYGLVILMTASFWLGERHELTLALKRHRRHTLRPKHG